MPVAPPSWAARPARARLSLVVSRLDTCQPAGGLQSERHREGLLKQSAPGHERIPVGASQAGARRTQAGQISVDQGTGTLGHQHRGRVEDVLAGCSPVHPRPGWGWQPGAEGGNQRDDRVAALTASPTQAQRVEVLRTASACDDLSGGRGDDAAVRFGPGQRGFDVQKRL